MTRQKRKMWDVHHIFPRSTFPLLSKASWNKRPVRRNHHEAWHLLVGNQSPLAGLVQLFHEFTPYDKQKLANDPALDEFIDLCEKLRKEVKNDPRDT